MTTNFNLDSPTDNVGLISHLFYSLSLYYQIMQVKCSDYPIPPHRYHLQRCTSVLTYRGGGGVNWTGKVPGGKAAGRGDKTVPPMPINIYVIISIHLTFQAR